MQVPTYKKPHKKINSRALFSPVCVLHVAQRNHIGKIGRIKHSQCIGYVRRNEGEDLLHVGILHNGVQVLHHRLDLDLREVFCNHVQWNGWHRRGQPQRGRGSVSCGKVIVIGPVDSMSIHGHKNGIDNEVVWRCAQTMCNLIFAIAPLGFMS